MGDDTIDLDGLRATIGSGNVLIGVDADPFLVDWRRVAHGAALAVVRPGSTQEVASVVRWAVDHDVVVVAQGGNTGMSAGATPVTDRPAIVLSLRRMDAIESVDADRWTMTVQAGATIQAMQEAATAAGRQFGPDWGARGSATIGGAISTDAGGNNVVRYGNLRDQVMGLEVVLADGRIWNGLRALRKDSSGYDLKQLFVGGEGTLGIVTRAVVKLHPATPHGQSALAALSGLDRLMELFALARACAGETLVAFEIMPTSGVDLVCSDLALSTPLATDAEFCVLVKVADGSPVTDRLASFLDRASADGLVLDAVVAATADQEERLWLIRDEFSPSIRFPERHRAGIKLDTAVPIDRTVELYRRVSGLAAEVVADAEVYAFGHVGDGNLHLYVLPGADEVAFAASKPVLMRRVDDLVIELGGTLSAEHGVGRDLRDRVGPQKSDLEWELMRRIKSALDPDDRLNPGALLPDPGVDDRPVTPTHPARTGQGTDGVGRP